MIPYADIIDTADRRWTSRLMERLITPCLPDDELDDLIEALQAVSDPRTFAMLEAILCDAARPAQIREAAGVILRSLHFVALDVPSAKLRCWWQEGDPILRRHALLSMSGARCPEIVLQVARDPSHEFHAEAVGCMQFWFDLPEHEEVKLAGLSHPDPRVRSAAAVVLVLDEPVAAEMPLLEATHDPVPEVVAEAANTLEYYPTQKVIRRLHELLNHPEEKVREEATKSFQSLRGEVLFRLCGKNRQVAGHLRRWLRPIWEMLAFTEEELQPHEDEYTPAWQEDRREAMSLADLLAMLTDHDVSPLVLGNRLRSNSWLEYNESERRRLHPALLKHHDQLVREQAAWAFAAWQDARGLLELVRDSDFCVRKSAM